MTLALMAAAQVMIGIHLIRGARHRRFGLASIAMAAVLATLVLPYELQNETAPRYATRALVAVTAWLAVEGVLAAVKRLSRQANP